ncbi:hypothetical protein [Pyrodictium delaneyi]|nr:hypothetical protein [Pyrodictium delaneyi]OWJ54234.1 hypothetical protein Pdsh_07010 [Pyrodictium delaneyi]
MLQNVYYLDVVQGHWYAVYTGGTPYRVFYVDGSGQTVYVTSYWWDANQSYIIFQAPITGKVYLREEPSLTLSTLSTTGWWNSISASVTITTNSTFPNGTYTMTFNPASITYDGKQLKIGYAASITKGWYGRLDVNTKYFFDFQSSITIDDSSLSVYARYVTSYYCYPSPTYCWEQRPVYSSPINGVAVNRPDPTQCNVVAKYSYVHGLLTVTATITNYGGSCETGQNEYILTLYTTKTVVVNDSFTADNGNTVHIVDSLTYADIVATSSSATYYLQSSQWSITFPNSTDIDKPLVLLLPSNISMSNPAAYIKSPLTAWAGVVARSAGNYTLLVFSPPAMYNTSSVSLDLVANYPYRYAIPPINVRYATRLDIGSILPVSGSFSVVNGVAVIDGNISLGQLIGSTLLLRGDLSNATITGAEAGNITIDGTTWLALYVYDTNAMISGHAEIAELIVLENTRTMMDYTASMTAGWDIRPYEVVSVEAISSASVSGSWAYRIPVYITLSYLPQSLTDTGYLFRLELPIGDWIRAGLLSPALEDLLIVDSSMQPLPFAIIKNDGEKAVVYVRYTRPLLSQSIVIYILLKNEQLWGTGNSFASLVATFDRINPAEGVDDLGWSYGYSYMVYNAWLFIGNATIAAGPTTFDFVAWEPSSGLIYEQHGSLVTQNISVTPASGDEVLVLFSNNYQDALVYVDGKPWYSIPLASFNMTSPAYYVKWKSAGAVYAGKMIPYSYAIGQIVGSLEQPAKVEIQQPVPQQPQQSASMWDLLAAMAPLFLLAIIVRLMQNPPAPAPYPR